MGPRLLRPATWFDDSGIVALIPLRRNASRIFRVEYALSVAVRQHGRVLAAAVGFTGSDLTVIAIAISEIARNIVSYAGSGEITIGPIDVGGQTRGVVIVAHDDGPGIPDIERALRDGFSTGRSLGLGLPGARRLMDEFESSPRWAGEPRSRCGNGCGRGEGRGTVVACRVLRCFGSGAAGADRVR